jgi:hypothetical protein
MFTIIPRYPGLSQFPWLLVDHMYLRLTFSCPYSMISAVSEAVGPHEMSAKPVRTHNIALIRTILTY